jgi:hypothetical protein
MIEAFLSHKAIHADAAKQLAKALSIIIRDDEIFLSEEIPTGDDYRDEITDALRNSSHQASECCGPRS